MTKARWQQIEAVFAAAIELPSEETSAYLDLTCNDDPELRREVENLLESDRRARGQIGSAVGQAAAAFAVQMQREHSLSQIGQRIGPYEIVREIGRGGMGSVYQAVRIDDQYIRSVAIKFIAQGMDTADALARFRTERQILATLQHPNIAGLLDGGTTPDGRPYIVMEYIEGEPILDYCRRSNLSIHDRLSLFCALCSAVHHAHQMLVIHRDIKPGNVLVNGDGIPKLLDFGIAKLLAPELVIGGAPSTHTIMRRMTPQYASPEQIRGEPLTTATDIYSLGVLLYEMLTHQNPYRITGQAPQEVERMVCDSEPLRLGASVKEDARLRRQLSGDLENITAMALRKEPQRRYGSVQKFAEDIQRFQQGMPVSAREDTIFYLARKLVRRNLLASAAFALLALSIGAGWFATYQQVKRTEARFQEVRKLANAVLFEFHPKIQNLPGATPARELLVRTALEYLNNLSKDGAGDPALQWELSQAYEIVGDVQGDPSGPNLGQFKEAMISYGKALSLVEPLSAKLGNYETLSCATWLYYKRGDLEIRAVGADSAVESYSRGLEIARRIQQQLTNPGVEDLLVNGYMRLANARTRNGSTKAALRDARLAAEAADRAALVRKNGGVSNLAKTRLQVGNLLWMQGDLQGAWRLYQDAVEWLEKLVKQNPQNPAYLEELEEAYRRSGDLQGNPAYFHFGDLAKAKLYHSKALRIATQLASRDTNDAMARAQLSLALRRLAAVTRSTEPVQAVALYRDSLQILEQLILASPEDLNYQRDLANTHLGLSHALRSAGKLRPALEELNVTLAMQRSLLEKNPDRFPVREDMFDSLQALGELKLQMGDTRAALESLTEAKTNAEAMASRNKDSLYSERCLGMIYQSLAGYHAYLARRGPRGERVQHAAAAEEWYAKALAVWSRWRSQHLAVPFSTNQEKEVQRLRAELKFPAA